MVKILIIGCGGIAGLRHIPALTDNPDAEVYGFFDGMPGRAAAAASKYGGKAYESLAEALSDPATGAAVICTPARSHCELAIKAMEAGKHVLCEKPMAANADDARAMIEASRRTGRKLMISHNQRRYAPHIKAKELLEKGEIGRLLTFRTFLGTKGPEYASVDGMNNAYFSRQMSGRGVMSDVGSHRVDLMHYMVGSRYKRVLSYTPTLAKCKPDGTPDRTGRQRNVHCGDGKWCSRPAGDQLDQHERKRPYNTAVRHQRCHHALSGGSSGSGGI